MALGGTGSEESLYAFIKYRAIMHSYNSLKVEIRWGVTDARQTDRQKICCYSSCLKVRVEDEDSIS